jgi:hypothetical protein
MKVTIEIEEKNGKLNIGFHEQGKKYTSKERRLVNIIAGTFPKSANVKVVAPKRNADRFANDTEAIEAFTNEVETLRLSPSAIVFAEWLFAKVSKGAK